MELCSVLTNLKPRKRVEETTYSIEFTDVNGCGFSFDADENGNPLFGSEAAKQNYESALATPEDWRVFNRFTENRHSYMEPASGTCSCGETVELVDEYMGACQCGKCGQWYNMFGQELLPPSMWEE